MKFRVLVLVVWAVIFCACAGQNVPQSIDFYANIDKNSSKNVGGNLAKNTSDYINSNQNINENSSQNFSKNTNENLSKNSSQNANENLSKNLSKSINENLSQNVNENSSKNLSKNTSKDFKIIDNKSKKELNFEEFLAEIFKFDIILLGEEHDKLSHHLAQKEIIARLGEIGDLAVVFEQLSSDKQEQITAAQKNAANIDKKDIKAALGWEWRENGYQQILESIFYTKTHIVAGNLSRAEIAQIYAGAEGIKGVISTEKSVRDKIAKIITAQHKMDETRLYKMLEIQQFKDRRMADKLIHASSRAVLIAGSIHTDKSMGVPLHILDFQRAENAANLANLKGENLSKNSPNSKAQKRFVIVHFGNSKSFENEFDEKECDFSFIFREKF